MCIRLLFIWLHLIRPYPVVLRITPLRAHTIVILYGTCARLVEYPRRLDVSIGLVAAHYASSLLVMSLQVTHLPAELLHALEELGVLVLGSRQLLSEGLQVREGLGGLTGFGLV